MTLDFEKDILDLEERIAALSKAQPVPAAAPPADGQAPAETQPAPSAPPPPSPELEELKKQLEQVKADVYAKLTPWQTVQVARHPARPLFRDYIAGVFSEFIELHGDRCFGDDKGMIGGFAKIDRHRVMVIGHQKGKTVEENVQVNFGMANPEGYRKALRLMKLAEKYRLPVLSFIDTPGAYPGADAEARGQAEAIAHNLAGMSQLQVPILVVVTGEGGSGGALGIAVGDVVLMLANAVYSVISPEGCASILWRDGAKAPEAAAALKLTAKSLLAFGIIDEIIAEPPGGAQRDHAATLAAVKECLLRHLKRLRGTSPRKLVERRYEKFARMGRIKGR
jgi:acetyl-CoA carboxylase carboxyl transferase subunit alpha